MRLSFCSGTHSHVQYPLTVREEQDVSQCDFDVGILICVKSGTATRKHVPLQIEM